jgi:hypothetical protein
MDDSLGEREAIEAVINSYLGWVRTGPTHLTGNVSGQMRSGA